MARLVDDSSNAEIEPRGGLVAPRGGLVGLLGRPRGRSVATFVAGSSARHFALVAGSSALVAGSRLDGGTVTLRYEDGCIFMGWRVSAFVSLDAARRSALRAVRQLVASWNPEEKPVSYTHLTLPTICSV